MAIEEKNSISLLNYQLREPKLDVRGTGIMFQGAGKNGLNDRGVGYSPLKLLGKRSLQIDQTLLQTTKPTSLPTWRSVQLSPQGTSVIRRNRSTSMNHGIGSNLTLFNRHDLITIIDKDGNLIQKGMVAREREVYLQKGKQLMYIGNLGKTIDANKIFPNLLESHIEEAKHIVSPWTFKSLVEARGPWDLKTNRGTIYGLAHLFDEGYETKTEFNFQGKNYSSEDIGNYHYGATGLATWFGNENLLLRQAGAAQMRSKTSQPEWQRYEITDSNDYNEMSFHGKIMLYPYGDDPQDQDMIKEGFQYYYSRKK